MRVRSSVGWYRHLTLVLLACAFLRRLSLQQTSPADPAQAAPHALPSDEEPAPAAAHPATPAPLIALTLSEIRHLLARLIWPAPTSPPLICHWSCWRRTHQSWAGYSHRRRREKARSA